MAARLIPCLFLVLLGGCSDSAPEVPLGADADEHGHTAALAATADANRAALDALPLADRSDEDDVRRGLLRAEPRVRVEDADGMVIWDSAAYAYIDGEAPDTVHPSLWRQETLNNVHGLFELADGVYQVRGYDLANMMLIAGETGWIVVDPLTAAETARAAMALVEAEFGPRPVSAVIFSHSHVDHFGGALGVVSPEDAAGIDVVAPAGFLEAATSENVLAGAAMTRRAAFMYGMRLAHGPRGHVGSGLGKAPARGTISVLPPTITIDRTPQPLMIDGVEFIFQNAPNTEAPAELVFYLPKQRLLAISELVMHTQHNLYTLRGAPVRDASAWSGAIDEAMRLFPDAEVLAPAHHWPTWGAEAIREQLALQRDLYRFIHDQTLRLANQGLTAGEIAETLELPESLAQA
ncbi:MAG: MBL fold metallo-hydrolase, partial [Pseudomonadota bacterium]